MPAREARAPAAGRGHVHDARESLRAAGLRVTAPRVTVYEALGAAGRPLTHAELADRLAARGLDRVTVWRNLTALAEAGLVSRRDVGDRVFRFAVRGAATPHDDAAHPHFVCTACGDVRCLDASAVRVDAAVAGAGVAVELKGRCVRCA